MSVPKAPWSAAAELPPWNSGKNGVSFAAALHNASRKLKNPAWLSS